MRQDYSDKRGDYGDRDPLTGKIIAACIRSTMNSGLEITACHCGEPKP